MLLGDTLELRHGPARAALSQAEPVLRELALAPSARWSSCPATTTTRCCEAGSNAAIPTPLGLESAVEWDDREALGSLVASLAPARVRVAYPGVWLREDVYAIHGHYGDRHNTVPILERLGAGLTVRVAGEPEGGPARAEDYEAALAPMYAWADTIAQSGGLHLGGGGSFQIAAWQALNGGAGRRSLRSRAMALGLAAAVAGLNRAGMGPLRPDVSGVALRRGALAGVHRGARPPRRPARARDLRAHAPRRSAARRRPERMGPAAQHRELGARGAVRRGRPARQPLPPRVRRDRLGTTARRSSSTC